jgi:hypothetical protein
MEKRIAEIRASSDSISEDAKIVSQTCILCYETIRRLSQSPPSPLNDVLDKHSEYVYGLAKGGTYRHALLSLGSFFSGVFGLAGAFAQYLESQHASLVTGNTKWVEDDNAARSAVDQEGASVRSVIQEAAKLCKSQAPKKIAQLIASATSKGKGGKVDVKKLQKLLQEARADRRRPEAAQNQHRILEKATESVGRYKDAVCRLIPYCQLKGVAINDILTAIQTAGNDTSAGLKGCSDVLRAAADGITHQSDFTTFVQRHGLIRYDLQCKPFEPFDLSHPVFADVAVKVQVAVPPLYPVGIAHVVRDFVAEAPKELSVTRGKYVLLMELPRSVWVWVMNPLTRAMGYAPAEALERIGSALAVVSGIGAGGNDVFLQLGDYLALLDNTESPLRGVTTKGENVIVIRDRIAIIYD